MQIPNLGWEDFKALILKKRLKIQELVIHGHYYLAAPDDAFTITCTIPKKNPTPDGSDQEDYEQNFQANSNQSIKHLLPTYKVAFLTNPGGSRQMNVSGSPASPVVFNFKPDPTDVLDVEEISIGIDDAGILDFRNFGGLPALANGLFIESQSRGITTPLINLKDNADIVMVFSRGILSPVGDTLDSNDGYYGNLVFKTPMRLFGERNDFIRATVRDDLRQIYILRVGVVLRGVL